MLLCTKKHVTSTVPTQYYNVLNINWEGIMFRPSQHFDTVCEQEQRTAVSCVKDTGVPPYCGKEIRSTCPEKCLKLLQRKLGDKLHCLFRSFTLSASSQNHKTLQDPLHMCGLGQNIDNLNKNT